MKLKFIFINIVVFTTILYGQYDSLKLFSPRTTLGIIEEDDLTEASGIVASKTQANVLWIHNDSGNDEHIYAVSLEGKTLGTYKIDNAKNRDWEDIAIEYDSSQKKSFIIIADIGDNRKERSWIYLYKFPEPIIDQTKANEIQEITEIQEYKLRYPDKRKYNAETFLVDPQTQDYYIVTKRNHLDLADTVFRASYPLEADGMNYLEEVAELNYPPSSAYVSGAVGGDVSSSGLELLIKTYDKVYYWSINENQPFFEMFAIQPSLVEYTKEPQGEAICWQYNDKGYFSVSEEPSSFLEAYLYYYKRNETPTGVEENFENSFQLNQNYPNPFNPKTTIEYQVGDGTRNSNSNVSLIVYDIVGRKIAALVNKKQTPGRYKVEFDGSNLSSGVYIYNITIGTFEDSKQMQLIK